MDRTVILTCFNEHFISTGSLFESLSSHPNQSNAKEVCTSNPATFSLADKFNFTSIDAFEVERALKQIDPGKSAGPDKFEPFFLRSAADFIAEPLTHSVQ